MTKKLAIVSVFDKTGVASFAQKLSERGIEILSTGGTSRHLADAGVPVTSISKYTGSPEILDGRVKSLHPKIHGGILARRDNDKDVAELSQEGISPIDYVIVNLYPFTQQVRQVVKEGKPDHESLVELIDIGGPTMIRAAAKNCAHVVVICDPSDYDIVVSEIDEYGDVRIETRRQLAAKVYATMAAYDGEVARYFSLNEQLLDEKGHAHVLAPYESIVLEKERKLRYGENPHQVAAFYEPFKIDASENTEQRLWEFIQGKELSYNNLVDVQAALDLFLDCYANSDGLHCSIIVKHTNPCGAATCATSLEAFKAARACDSLSAFGGIIAVSGTVDKELAATILEQFVEVVLVSDIDDDAIAIFKKKKNVRLLRCDYVAMATRAKRGATLYRAACGGVLAQTSDVVLANLSEAKIVAGAKQVPALLSDLTFAWKVCKHVKSNAIVIVKDQTAIGVGVGQMSRVDSAQLAIRRAKTHGHSIEGAVAASDAFLPFSDTLEVLNDAGVVALVQPGGSLKDSDVIAEAESRNVTMLFTGNRHFKH